MACYTDVHRAFLQAISHHGAVSAKQVHVILQSIYANYEAVQQRDNPFNVITAINAKIIRYSQKIKLVRYEPSGTDFYVFCSNLSESPLNRLQTTYSEPEVTYFGLVLKEIACSEDQKAKEMVCINLTVQIPARPAFTKVRAEQLLDEWTKSGYFGQLDGMMILGPRAVAEFDQFLRVHYEDRMEICLMCKEVVFYGVKCSNCPEMFHSKCKETYLRRIVNCPGCQKMLEVPEVC